MWKEQGLQSKGTLEGSSHPNNFFKNIVFFEKKGNLFYEEQSMETYFNCRYFECLKST